MQGTPTSNCQDVYTTSDVKPCVLGVTHKKSAYEAMFLRTYTAIVLALYIIPVYQDLPHIVHQSRHKGHCMGQAARWKASFRCSHQCLLFAGFLSVTQSFLVSLATNILLLSFITTYKLAEAKVCRSWGGRSICFLLGYHSGCFHHQTIPLFPAFIP